MLRGVAWRVWQAPPAKEHGHYGETLCTSVLTASQLTSGATTKIRAYPSQMKRGYCCKDHFRDSDIPLGDDILNYNDKVSTTTRMAPTPKTPQG